MTCSPRRPPGRRLQAYQAVRAVLVEQLGLEPGPEPKAAEAAVLAHDASLAPTVAGDPSAPGNLLPARTGSSGENGRWRR